MHLNKERTDNIPTLFANSGKLFVTTVQIKQISELDLLRKADRENSATERDSHSFSSLVENKFVLGVQEASNWFIKYMYICYLGMAIWI